MKVLILDKRTYSLYLASKHKLSIFIQTVVYIHAFEIIL